MQKSLGSDFIRGLSMAPLEPSWNEKTYQFMAAAYTNQHLWVKIFTFLSGFIFVSNILKLNIPALVILGVILFACFKAWQSLTLFKNATEHLKYQQGLESLRDYLKWQTIGTGIFFTILLILLVIFFVSILFFILAVRVLYA